MLHYYQVKHEVAFIPQRIPRWFGSLKDNLHFYASVNGFYGSENELMTDFMLTRFGLTRFANLSWNQLSSGYRTRFEIAKILLKRPKLLILDEPAGQFGHQCPTNYTERPAGALQIVPQAVGCGAEFATAARGGKNCGQGAVPQKRAVAAYANQGSHGGYGD